MCVHVGGGCCVHAQLCINTTPRPRPPNCLPPPPPPAGITLYGWENKLKYSKMEELDRGLESQLIAPLRGYNDAHLGAENAFRRDITVNLKEADLSDT